MAMAATHLRVVDPDDEPTPTPASLATDAYSREERLALYREGVENLRALAREGKDTAKSIASAKLAAIFADSQTNQRGSQKLVISFIDPRVLRDDPDDPLGIGLPPAPQDQGIPAVPDVDLDENGELEFKI